MVRRKVKTTYKRYTLNKDGVKAGVFRWFWPSGNIFVECMYNGGVRDGGYISYWDNGMIWKKIEYRSGLLHGDYIEYDEEGNIVRSTFMHNDIDMGFDPRGMTDEEKAYAILSGRKPESCVLL